MEPKTIDLGTIEVPPPSLLAELLADTSAPVVEPKPEPNLDYVGDISREIMNRLPENHGFVLLTFPNEGVDDSALGYASTIGSAETVQLLTEFLESVKAKTQTKKD